MAHGYGQAMANWEEAEGGYPNFHETRQKGLSLAKALLYSGHSNIPTASTCAVQLSKDAIDAPLKPSPMKAKAPNLKKTYESDTEEPKDKLKSVR